MQVSVSLVVRKIGFGLWFLILIPALVTGAWWFIQTAFPQLEGWWIVLALQLFLSLYILYLFSDSSHDVTTIAERERRLEASQQQFIYLYERSPVPYVTIDQKGVITRANLAAVRLLDTTTEDIIGQDFLSKISTEEDLDLSVALGKLKSGVSINELEAKLMTNKNALRWIQLSIFVEGSSSNERLVAMIDITQKKTVDQAKSEFVALASHQLRTPISAIKWNVELLRGNDSTLMDGKQRKYFMKIERNVTRMVNLINDFLNVSKLETGTFAAEMATVKLDEYLSSVLDEYAGMIEQKKIQVTTNFQPVQFSFTADTRLLHIIMSNLTSNALKYVGDQGVVSLEYSVRGSDLIVTITDNGIGIPAHELENLFTKFYRATNARTHKAEGTGLGLYIVKQAVEMMGGRIEVASVVTEGTKFTISLPIRT